MALAHDGLLALKTLENKSTESEFREKLTFDFAQNSDPGAQDELIHMAKFDPEAKGPWAGALLDCTEGRKTGNPGAH